MRIRVVDIDRTGKRMALDVPRREGVFGPLGGEGPELSIAFVCAGGDGQAVWRTGYEGGEPVEGETYNVELGAEEVVRLDADGTLTSAGRGRCRLKGTVEHVYDGILTLRIGGDLLIDGGFVTAEIDGASAPPPAGSEVLLRDVPLSAWPC